MAKSKEKSKRKRDRAAETLDWSAELIDIILFLPRVIRKVVKDII